MGRADGSEKEYAKIISLITVINIDEKKEA